MLVHRHMPAGPDPFLTAVAPSRDDLVVCVACLFPWYWLADLCAREGRPFVLGHALSMTALHGGKATNNTLDTQKIAGLLRGGMWPQAQVSASAMRATRDLLRRRIHLMRTRAALLTPVPHTHRQYNVPEIGTKIVYKTNRPGGAERFADPAVPKSVEGELALIDNDDQRLRDLDLALVKTAKQHDANTRYLLQTVPGIGQFLRLGLRRVVFDLDTFLQREGRGAGEPAASLGHPGRSLAPVRGQETPRALPPS